MKILLSLLAAAGLTGCAVYPAPYDTYGEGGPQPYLVQPSVSIYGAGVYRYDNDGRAYANQPRGRNRDRDHDGVPDRVDRDRDGDGVPNRRDERPGDPRR